VFPQGPLGPPAPRGSRVEPRGARAGQNRAPRAAQAVPGGEALSTKMGDAHAEHAPEGLVDPAVAWGTLGAHVVTARGARRACGGGGVSVRSLRFIKNRGSLPKKIRRVGDMLSVQHGTHGDGQTRPALQKISAANGRFAAKSNARRLGRLTQMPCPCSHAMLPCSHAPHKEGCPLGSGRRLRLPLGKYT
jgi:hypothetical protein